MVIMWETVQLQNHFINLQITGMTKPKFKTRSTLFESTYVKGDKITLHKCVIDKAIKEIKADPDIFLKEERKAGRLDILEELLEIISYGE